MAQENTILKKKLKHKGFWSFKDFYEFCFGWFQDNGFYLAENEYVEKITPIGKNIEIKWEATKKITDYFQYKIKLAWQISGLVEAEVEEEGKKIKTNKGEIKLTFEAILVKDYESKWEDRPIWKFLRGTYDKYIIRTTSEEQEGKIVDETNELIDQIKAFLNLGQ